MGAVNIFGQKQRRTGLLKKPVIKGEFSSYKINYKELGLYKLNKFLSLCLLMLSFLLILCYLVVISREAVVKDLHKKTNEIYYENIELQNNVDNLKSFYAIDNKVSQINFLKKADKVIEVQALYNVAPKKKNNNNKQNLKQVPTGF